MTLEIASVLGIIVVAVILLALDLLRVDMVAIGVFLLVTMSGLISASEAFSAFSSTAAITVGSMFVVSSGLLRAGIASYVGRGIVRVTGASEVLLIIMLMLTSGLMSAFMNSVGVAAMLLPAVISISRATDISPSKLCIPLGFGSLVGGVGTLIGTPANLLISDALRNRGFAAFGIFDFTAVGLVLLLTTIAYMAFVGRRLLPDHPLDRRLSAGASLTRKARETYRIQERIFVLRLLPDSPLAGKTVLESELGKTLGLTILTIERQGRSIPAPSRDEVLQSGDVLLVEGTAEAVSLAQRTSQLAIEQGVTCEVQDLQSEDVSVAEMVLAPHSQLMGKTLEGIRFRDRFGLTVLAVWREGRPRRTSLADLPLRLGDALLVQGPRDNIRLLDADRDFLLLELSEESVRANKVRFALSVLMLVVLAQATGVLSISLATFLGAALMVVGGCLTIDEAYAAVDWRVIFLIAGMLPLGLALEASGAARYLADLIIGAVGGAGPYMIQIGILTLTIVLTQVLPSAATAVLMAPIALDTAAGLGTNPRALLLGVAMLTSASFVTPIGHKVNVLVMGPGNYRFSDYTRVGLPLNLLVYLIIVFALPIL